VPWCKALFKGAQVLARCDAEGRLIAENGRVEIRYKPQDGRAYHAAERNLVPVSAAEILPEETCAPAEAAPDRRKPASRGARAPATRGGGSAAPVHDAGAIIVYADGACSGNPGPAGAGVVMIDGGSRRELSHYLGTGTNNIAELTAIELAAQAIAERERPVRMHTDSQYAIGVLTKGWKAKANVELVARLRALLGQFTDLELRYVPGHAGVVLNERADVLAVQAVERRESSGWVEL
jgi:ribonuclease HI